MDLNKSKAEEKTKTQKNTIFFTQTSHLFDEIRYICISSWGNLLGQEEKSLIPKKAEAAAPTLTKGEEPTARKPEEWTKVVCQKRHQKKKKIRPEVIIISKKRDISYADILRKVKADPELTVLGNSVSRIRRTHKEDLMLEQNKSNEKTA